MRLVQSVHEPLKVEKDNVDAATDALANNFTDALHKRSEADTLVFGLRDAAQASFHLLLTSRTR